MINGFIRSAAAIVFTLAAGLVLGQTPTKEGLIYERASFDAISRNPALEYSPYTVIVRFEQNVPAGKKASAVSAVNGVFVKSLVKDLGIELIGTVNPEMAIAYLRLLPSVKYAELDYVVHRTVIPNDPSFGSLWGMHNTGQTGGLADADIDAPEAWDVFTGDPNLVIADIDTGVDYTHPDLAANIWTNPGEIAGNGIDDDGNGFIDDTRGWDFVNNDNDPIDDNGHGSHTSGTVGAVGNNGVGVTGVNWQCKIMPLKFLNAAGSGSTAGAISCVNYAVQKGVKISNNSWGGGGFSQALYDAINNGKTVGHIFVAAAGNAGSNNDVTPFYPATYDLDNLIAVASTDQNDNRSSFSNFGATTVDIGGPGSSILSTYSLGRYANLSGTSMATPHVAGVVGLVYGLHPTWTYQQVRQQVFNSARPIAALSGITVTGGMVNAAAAVAGAANTPPSVLITSPANGSSFVQGTTVNFAGAASDVQEGDLTAGLVWTSNLQGQIGTGGSFSRSDLVLGTHTVTAAVTDGGGLQGSSSITLTITSGVTVPAAPSNLQAVRFANDVARLTWTDNSSNETNFDVERQRRIGGNTWGSTTIITVGANVNTLQDAAGNGKFRYRVRSRNSAGASAYTPYANVNL